MSTMSNKMKLQMHHITTKHGNTTCTDNKVLSNSFDKFIESSDITLYFDQHLRPKIIKQLTNIPS